MANGDGLWSLNTETATPLSGSFNPNRDGSNSLLLEASNALGSTHSLTSDLTIRFPYPDLVLSSVSLPGGLGLSNQTLRAQIINAAAEGPAGPANAIPGQAQWIDRYFLSPDPIFANGNDIGLGDFIPPLGRGIRHSGPLAPGESRENMLNVQLPERPGDYYLITTLDNTTSILEGLGEGNNVIISATPVVHVDAVYHATISSNRDHLTAGESVELNGLLSRLDTGAAVANKPVTITLVNTTNNRVITLSATSRADGTFSSSFVPTVEQAGNYAITARWTPNINEDSSPEDTFSVAGLGFVDDSFFYSTIDEGGSLSGSVSLRNFGSNKVDTLLLSPQNLPSNWIFTTTTPPASLAPGATTSLQWQLTVPDAAVLSHEFQLTVNGLDGGNPLVASKRFGIRVEPNHSVLQASPVSLNGTMLRGGSTPLDVLIRNTGSASSGPIDVVLPFPWMRLHTPSSLPPLQPGQESIVHLTLAPPADLDLGLYSGNIGFLDEDNSQYSSVLPFSFRATSNLTGNVHVRFLDDISLASPGTPAVANVNIELLDGLTGSLLRSLRDDDGILTFEDLPEGDYQIRANAAKHSQGLQRFSVRSGSEQSLDVFLPFQGVRYNWSVVPVTLTDEYKITLDATFETEVPIPVLTISPGSIELCDLDQVGEQEVINLTITNHGLVRASNLEFLLPSHPNFNFSLSGLPPTLEAKQAEVVTLTIDRVADLPNAPQSINWGQLDWEYTTVLPDVVAPIKVPQVTPLPFLLCPTPLPEGGIDFGFSPGGGGGGGGGGGFTFNPGVVVTVPSSDPVPYVPARVGIQLNQRAVLSRGAFEGTFSLENLDPGVDLTNILVNLEVYDKTGQIVTDRFAISSPVLRGFNGNINGSGSLGRTQTGTAVFTILANNEAAPIEPTEYSIGGSFSYLRNETPVNYNLIPAPITVTPAPVLSLDYFLQRDVFSDDPFTTAIEPSRPFVLGMLARNSGYGTANNLSITSGQPQIVDNQTGLLIDFKLIGSSVGSQSNLVNPSLTVNFGQLPPQATKEAHWLMTSTLQGRFVDYKANVEYLNPLGFKDLAASFSQFQNVKLHELNHMVRDDRPGADQLFDYLVNDNPPLIGEDNTFRDLDPDRLYLSNGAVEFVDLISSADISISATNRDNEHSLSFSGSGDAPWHYLSINDPANGSYSITSIRRQDGTLVSPSNYWITDRTFPVNGRPTYEFKLHLLDHNSSSAENIYTIIYRTAQVNTPPSPASALADQQVAAGEAFSFIIPLNTFTDPDPEDQLFYSLRTASGAALPAWLTFDPLTRLIHGTPGAMNLGSLLLDVVATDSFGANATSRFKLLVSPAVPAPTLSVIPEAADQPEGNSGSTHFTFTVRRDGETSGNSTATWSVSGTEVNGANLDDYSGGVLPNGLVSFGPGDVSQTITVQVSGDGDVENDEHFTVTLSNPINASLATASATGVILNDDTPPPTLTLLSTASFTEDSAAHGIGSVVASFSTAHSLSVALSDTLHYTLGAGSDAGKVLLSAAGLALVNSGTDLPAFTLTPSQGTINGTAVSVAPTVIPTNDGPASFSIAGSTKLGNTLTPLTIRADLDGNGAFAYDWQSSSDGSTWSPVGSEAVYTIAPGDEGKQLRLQVTYTDGQGFPEMVTTPAVTVPLLPTLTISAGTTTQQEGNIGSTPYVFTLSRSGDLSGESRVSWIVAGSGANPATAADFAGGQLPGGTAVFAAGQQTASLGVDVVGDGVLEPDEGFRIQLHSPVGARLSGASSSGLMQILNDDQPAPSYTFVATPETVYEGGTLHIGVSTTNVAAGRSLWWQLSGPGLTTSDVTDGLLSGSTVIGLDGRASFTKAIAADAVVDSDERLAVSFHADAARTQSVGSSLTVTLKEASVGVVTDGNDIITGTVAAETITGVPAASVVRGRGSLDRLSGGAGADHFLLGDDQGLFYNDASTGLGTTDLALITDFMSGDRIQLHGTNTAYRLISGRYAGNLGVRIDALVTTPGNTPEAIGFVQGATLASLNLANTNQFLYI
ncbi:MAG: putative Ig domain-containing protein [Cyanobacteriota bacterium]